MFFEPITIYSSRVDPAGVLNCLRKMAPDLQTDAEQGQWSRININLKRGILRKSASLQLTHARDYYQGDDFRRQMNGMQGYFARFPKNHLTPRLMMTIDSFRFAISVFPEPDPPLNIESTDERLKFVYAIAQHLDGAIFTPSGLRDASGRVICHASLPPDPAARIPTISVPAPQASQTPRYWGGTMPNPPSPPSYRVVKRALCLMSVAYRGMLERVEDTLEKLEARRRSFLKWVDDAGIAEELEQDERQLLGTPIHQGASRTFMDAEWKIEGAAVLAWACSKLDLPAYDQEVDVGVMGAICGLSDPTKALAFQAGAALRGQTELERFSTQLLEAVSKLHIHKFAP